MGCYKDAYLIQFGETATDKYKNTHNGMWANWDQKDHLMNWWIESVDFEVIN
jgi:hypothetical protein